MIFFLTSITPGHMNVGSRSLTDFEDRLLYITFDTDWIYFMLYLH